MVAKLVEDIPSFPLRTAIRPGITGWAQVRAGYAASVDESLSKLEYDLYYGLYSSFVFDVEIIFRTAMVAIFGDRQAQAQEERITMQALVEESAGRWARQQQLASGQ
jgi:lipopolysaccharide/colanic/teichoic acid biosynthesis glycosyltransferase